VEIANTKFRIGKGSQADVLKAQVELSLLFQRLPVLEQRRETTEAMLNTLVNRNPASPLGMAQEPSQLPLEKHTDDLHRLALNDRPELKAAELAVQRNEQSHALAQRQYYPDFNVAFQRFQNYQTNDGFGAYVAMSIPFAFWTKPKYDLREPDPVSDQRPPGQAPGDRPGGHVVPHHHPATGRAEPGGCACRVSYRQGRVARSD
jgi:outer membrane protein TolC